MNYELGVKLDMFDRRLRINSAMFYMDYDPRLFETSPTPVQPASNPDPGPPFFLRRARRARRARRSRARPGISPWFYYQNVPAR